MGSIWDDLCNITADIVTLGAVSRVEDSIKEFNSVKWDYEKKHEELVSLLKEYNLAKKIFAEDIKYLRANKSVLSKKSNIFHECLDEFGNELLTLIYKDLPVKTLDRQICLSQFDGSFSPEDADDCISATVATLLMGPFGIIGAHGSASEQCEENSKRAREIARESAKIVKDILLLKNEYAKLIKQKKASEAIIEILKQIQGN